jgi:hypothetical protein
LSAEQSLLLKVALPLVRSLVLTTMAPLIVPRPALLAVVIIATVTLVTAVVLAAASEVPMDWDDPNYDEMIRSKQDIIEQYGIHPDSCHTLPDGQLVCYLQVWKWSDGTFRTEPEPDHAHLAYLDCVKTQRHYISYDGHCHFCGSSKL